MNRTFVLMGVALALAATSAQAQTRDSGIPRDHVPPRGLCRVWLDDRPVWRQPAVTDCATARRTAPAHSRIIHTDASGRTMIIPRVADIDRDYDRRADPRSPYYDARYDRNSRHYDHRLASHDRREREKWERQREKERERERRERERGWDRDHDRGDRDRDRVYRSRVNSDSREWDR